VPPFSNGRATGPQTSGGSWLRNGLYQVLLCPQWTDWTRHADASDRGYAVRPPALLEESGRVAKTKAMDTGRRWLAVGHSAASDSRQAGRDAARNALDGADPALLVVFSSGPDPHEMLAGIDDVCPGVPLIGCASQALICSPSSNPVSGV